MIDCWFILSMWIQKMIYLKKSPGPWNQAKQRGTINNSIALVTSNHHKIGNLAEKMFCELELFDKKAHFHLVSEEFR